MQAAEVEREVERIAICLGRGVSLEDLDGVLLAYSSHQSSADRVRVNFLLSKKVPADVSAWQLQHGISTAVRPVAVPANDELGMLGRVCVPLLVRGFRVGYLWVQQDAGEVTARHILEQLPRVRDEMDRLAALLLEGNTAGSEHRSRREAVFLSTLERDGPATEDFAGWPELTGSDPWHLTVLLDGSEDSRKSVVDPHAGTLAHRTAALQATVGADAVVFSAGTPSHAILLFRHEAGKAEQAAIRRRYADRLETVTGVGNKRMINGSSEPFAAPDRLAEAYAQAKRAAQAAAVDAQLGDSVDFRSIGAYQFLAGGGWQSAVRSVYFAEIEDQDRNSELLPVLELLFDKNGSVQEVADQLHLHRSSIYNRLSRVRSIIGADPLGGQVRLELHLALKARRWSRRPRI